jgi:hypothetical protein
MPEAGGGMNFNGFEIVLSVGTGINTLALLIVAFRAGAYSRQVEVNTGRITALEEHGSAHAGRLEEKLNAILDRIRLIEQNIDEMRWLKEFSGDRYKED